VLAPMPELAASLVVASLVSLLKEKVYVQLAPGPVQCDGGQGEAHHKTLMRWLPAILDIIGDDEFQ